MTTISAQSILASRHAQTGDTIHTLLLRYPRWIHAEKRTHRLHSIGEEEDIQWAPGTPSLMEDPNLSRNASSSRAIPVEKLIQDVLDDPAVPLFWGKNQKGMQAKEENSARVTIKVPVPTLTEKNGHPVPHLTWQGEAMLNVDAWLVARDQAVEVARAFSEAGYHKQIVNRLLEPFSHITVLVSSTNWSNFLALRDHPDAEPHMQLLAKKVRKAIDEAVVEELHPGSWHLPFASRAADVNETFRFAPHASIEEREQMLIKLSVARCASTSYKTVDGFDMTLERAIALHDKLVGSTPLHASPAEHVCKADEWWKFANRWSYPKQHGNFVGFRQYRKMLPNECL